MPNTPTNPKRLRIATVVGARPQFIKAAAVSRAFAEWNASHPAIQFDEHIVHTGQHYDSNMSQVFFDELRIPPPKINLHVGSGGHGKQTGLMLDKLEETFVELQPDWVLVYGDTNSTLAGALAAVKLHVPVAHVEAGLRSFNRRMPEEINRVLTDQISTLLFCPTATAVDHLKREGIQQGVHQIGDVMRDAFEFNISLSEAHSQILEKLQLAPKQYSLVTVHRAESTDDPLVFKRIVDTLLELTAQGHRLVFPVHPRTAQTLTRYLPQPLPKNLLLVEPLPYLDMLALERNSSMILTDSGGVQKEASWAGVPCVTLRNETEWVETVQAGHNFLAGTIPDDIIRGVQWAQQRGGFTANGESGPDASTLVTQTLATTELPAAAK